MTKTGVLVLCEANENTNSQLSALRVIAGLGQATKYVAFEGRQWHADCFMCHKCDKSLLGQGFLVCEGNVVCPDCGKNM